METIGWESSASFSAYTRTTHVQHTVCALDPEGTHFALLPGYGPHTLSPTSGHTPQRRTYLLAHSSSRSTSRAREVPYTCTKATRPSSSGNKAKGPSRSTASKTCRGQEDTLIEFKHVSEGVGF